MGLVHSAADLAGAVRIVCEKIDIDIEGDEESLVFGCEDVFQELGACALFERQDVGLGAGGIEQNADSEREVLFLGEVFDDLRLFVFGDEAVIFF